MELPERTLSRQRIALLIGDLVLTNEEQAQFIEALLREREAKAVKKNGRKEEALA